MIFIVREFSIDYLSAWEGTLEYTILSEEEGNKGWDNAQDFFVTDTVVDCMGIGPLFKNNLEKHGVTKLDWGEDWEGEVTFNQGDTFMIPRYVLNGKVKWVLITHGV